MTAPFTKKNVLRSHFTLILLIFTIDIFTKTRDSYFLHQIFCPFIKNNLNRPLESEKRNIPVQNLKEEKTLGQGNQWL